MEIEDIAVDQTTESQLNEADEDQSIETAQAEDGEGNEADQTDAQAQDEPGDEPWPKKAENAISRRDRNLAKQRQEIAALQQKIAEFERQSESQANQPTAPKEDDFDNYADYLDARQQFNLQKQLAEMNLSQKQPEQKSLTPEQVQQQAWAAERENAIAEKAQQYAKELPDFNQLLQENADIFDSLSPQVEAMFLNANDGAMAAYNLAKEGKLEQLAYMPPEMAAMTIMQADQKGYQAPKKVSQAPKPISSAKGSGSATKSAEDMSYDELVKALGS